MDEQINSMVETIQELEKENDMVVQAGNYTIVKSGDYEKLVNGVNPGQKALHIDSVSQRIDFEKLRQDYFKECVDKANGKSKLYVCLAPHDLFEWFRKEILEYGG